METMVPTLVQNIRDRLEILRPLQAEYDALQAALDGMRGVTPTTEPVSENNVRPSQVKRNVSSHKRRRRAYRGQNEQRILNALADEPLTAREVIVATGIDDNVARSTLGKMTREHKLMRYERDGEVARWGLPVIDAIATTTIGKPKANEDVVEPQPDRRPDDQAYPLSDQIIAAISMARRPLTSREIAEATGARRTTVSSKLAKMKKQGAIMDIEPASPLDSKRWTTPANAPS